MDTLGKMITPDTLRFERTLHGPIERVWAYLTESEKRGKWLAKGDMELFEGGRVTLYFLHKELSPVPGAPPEKYKNMESGHGFTGTVLKINPPRLLSFSWEDQSEVTFELQEKEDKVLLLLTHRKLAVDKDTRASVSAGWHTHLDILISNFSGDTPPNFWQRYSQMEEVYRKQQTPAGETGMLIRKPVAETFEAFINPDITTKFWFTKSTGRLEKGKAVKWTWEMYNVTSHVVVKDLVPNNKLEIEWGAEDKDRTRVEWKFTPIDEHFTFVDMVLYGCTGY